MRRVVVTGLGLVASIGSTVADATVALRQGRSGVKHCPELLEAGLSCPAYAPVCGFDAKRLPKRSRKTMSDSATYAASAALDALSDARLDLDRLDPDRTGAVIGSDFGGINEVSKMHGLLMSGKKSRAGVVGVTKFMNSTASANVAAMLGLHGRTSSISTCGATGTDSIGNAYELVRRGLLDVALAGATEEDSWRQIGLSLERAGLLPNEQGHPPQTVARPFDADRRGFVMSAGAGVLVLETRDHAERRGAPVRAEILGYGASHDGARWTHPNGDGLARAIRRALAGNAQELPQVDFVCAHATGTASGDATEAATLRSVLGEGPLVSSVKGLTGHALGAAGALDAVYTLIMMSSGFVAPTTNLQTVAPECAGLEHVTVLVEREIRTAVCYAQGFDGFHSAVVFGKADARQRR